MNIKNEIVLFKDGELEVEVLLSPSEDTVWLTQTQIAKLFGKDRSTITEHINNIFEEGELDEVTSVGISHGSVNKNSRPPKIYNLDVVLSVGYRVKSKKGTAFRKWSSSVLHEYITKGYVINQRKLNAPNLGEIVQMLDEYRKVDSDLLLSGNGMLEFLIAYNKGLKILDDYDHKAFQIPSGSEDIYRISYEECMNVILESEYSRKKDNFAKERDESFMSSISVIYQTFDGKELYESLESKAANLLYLITKNHSFIDGNKRIASIIFLYFLDKNNALFINGRNRISNETLATLTILIASSNPKDKELIINLILVLLEV